MRLIHALSVFCSLARPGTFLSGQRYELHVSSLGPMKPLAGWQVPASELFNGQLCCFVSLGLGRVPEN